MARPRGLRPFLSSFVKSYLFLSVFVFSLFHLRKKENLLFLFVMSYHHTSSTSSTSTQYPQQSSLAPRRLGGRLRSHSQSRCLSPLNIILPDQTEAQSHFGSSPTEERESSCVVSDSLRRSSTPSYVDPPFEEGLVNNRQTQQNVLHRGVSSPSREINIVHPKTTVPDAPTLPSSTSPEILLTQSKSIGNSSASIHPQSAFENVIQKETNALSQYRRSTGEDRIPKCLETTEIFRGELQKANEEPAVRDVKAQLKKPSRMNVVSIEKHGFSAGGDKRLSLAKRSHVSHRLDNLSDEETRQSQSLTSPSFQPRLSRGSRRICPLHQEKHRLYRNNRIGFTNNFAKNRRSFTVGQRQIFANKIPAFLSLSSLSPLCTNMSMARLAAAGGAQPNSLGQLLSGAGVGENKGQPLWRPFSSGGSPTTTDAPFTPLRNALSASVLKGEGGCTKGLSFSSSFLGRTELSPSGSVSSHLKSAITTATPKHGWLSGPQGRHVYLDGMEKSLLREPSMNTSFPDWRPRRIRKSGFFPSSFLPLQSNYPARTRGQGIGSMMMKVYKGKEIRELSTPEIEREVLLTRQEIARLELLKRAYSTEFKPHMLKEAKRYLAQLLTIRYERHLGIRPNLDPWQAGPLGPALQPKAEDTTRPQGLAGSKDSSPLSSSKDEKLASLQNIQNHRPVVTTSLSAESGSKHVSKETTQKRLDDSKAKKDAEQVSDGASTSRSPLGYMTKEKPAGISTQKGKNGLLQTSLTSSSTSSTSVSVQSDPSSRQQRSSSSGGRETAGKNASKDPLREESRSSSPERKPQHVAGAKGDLVSLSRQGSNVRQSDKEKGGKVTVAGGTGTSTAVASPVLDEQPGKEETTLSRSALSSASQGRTVKEKNTEKGRSNEPPAATDVTRTVHSTKKSEASSSQDTSHREPTRRGRKPTSEVGSKQGVKKNTQVNELAARGGKESPSLSTNSKQESGAAPGTRGRDLKPSKSGDRLCATGAKEEETVKHGSIGMRDSILQDSIKGSATRKGVRSEVGDGRHGDRNKILDDAHTEKSTPNRKNDRSVHVDSTRHAKGGRESSQPAATADRRQNKSSIQHAEDQPASVSPRRKATSLPLPEKAAKALPLKEEKVSMTVISETGDDRTDAGTEAGDKKVREEHTSKAERQGHERGCLFSSRGEKINNTLPVDKGDLNTIEGSNRGASDKVIGTSGQARMTSSTSLSSSSKSQRSAARGSPVPTTSSISSQRPTYFRSREPSSSSLSSWSASPCSFKEFVASEFASRNSPAASRPMTRNEGFLSSGRSASSVLSSRLDEPASEEITSPLHRSSSVLPSLNTPDLSAEKGSGSPTRPTAPTKCTGLYGQDAPGTRSGREERAEVVSKRNWISRADGLQRV
ncbi:ribosomal protein rpl29 [Cystoisospora suis]|uniref:Ribosomal protein rpl29 n=1 Tax=Cystoisospora suis TaxID=483139 RepID=A0A2C6L7E6_9APIC|nr:ribosomal protein rpl29 [Cystoisospora suis]